MFKKLMILGVVFIIAQPLGLAKGSNQTMKNIDDLQTTMTCADPDINTLLPMVNESVLRYYIEKFVSFGSKTIGSPNCRNTAEWIEQEFKALGLFTYLDEWKYPRYRDRNVVAIQRGTDPTSDAVIVLCAHYDTTGDSPGAVDDGSGIAAILTIANITSRYAFNHTIRFVAVSGEEVGTYGSFADAKNAYAHQENILAVLNLDMVGYTNSSLDCNYMHIGGPERTKWLIDVSLGVAQQFKEQIDLEIVPLFVDYPCDHAPYHDYGYDGVWCTQYNPDQFQAMHTPGDTIDKVNFTYCIKMTKLVLAIAATLALKTIAIQVSIATPSEGTLYLRNIPLVKLPCYNVWRMNIRAVTYVLGKTTVTINITTDEIVSYVYYAVDGYIKHVTNIPPYQYTIGKGNLEFYYKLHKGYHRVMVCVVTNNGKIASDEIDIFVFKLL